MERYAVRDLVHAEIEQIRQLPEWHLVLFDDDSEIEVTRNETMYSWYFWTPFRMYPQTKILAKHHATSVLKGQALNTDTHTKLCSHILKSVCLDNQLLLPEQKEPVLAEIYRCASRAMSELSMETEENVTSLDILDFVQIAMHPHILALKEEAYADTNKIKYVYEQSMAFIKTEPSFWNNGLAKSLRAKMVKENQVQQCVVFRGFGAEVDGSVFHYKPIWSNYTLGNRSLYDYAADSRTAAKSHFYSDTALKDSEYMARQFQLFAMVLERIVYQDCGSTEHTSWTIQGPQYDKAGAEIYRGDLSNLVGKYYKLNLEDTEYKEIEGNETDLIGKTVYFRSVLKCKASNPHHVCHICAGGLAANVSRFANAGHLGAVTTTKPVTQNILSIKHVNMSATLIRILLGEYERKFFHTGADGAAYYILKSVLALKPTMTLIRDEAFGLIDLKSIDDLEKISLPRMSEITEILLSTSDQGRAFNAPLSTKQKGKSAMLSRELLRHLKKVGWTVDENNDFVFSLKGWNPNDPLFVMQNKEESYVDLSQEVNVLVQSNQKELKKRTQRNAADILLQELFSLVNAKLNVNILAFEMTIYGLMVESANSYAMGRNKEDVVLGIAKELNRNRCLSSAYAYEGQHLTMLSPTSFFQGKRPDSPMDVFLNPKEVVAAYPAHGQQ